MEQQQANISPSTPSTKFEVIDAEPLAEVPPNLKPRRIKNSKENLKEGKSIGLPEGWSYELRPRTNVNYIGKIDQFFYEPGTNRQFRSMKSVEKYLEKYLESKGQKIKPITPDGLLGNTQQNITVAPAPVPFDLDNANCESHNPEPHNNSSKMMKKKAIPNLYFNFKDTPQEVTWVLSDAQKDKWTPFLGDIKVGDEVQHFWAETFRIINGLKEAHHDDKALVLWLLMFSPVHAVEEQKQ